MAGLKVTKRPVKVVDPGPGPNGKRYQIWFRRRLGGQALLIPGIYAGPGPANRIVWYVTSKGLRNGAHYVVPVGDDPNHPELAYAFGPGKNMWGWFINFG